MRSAPTAAWATRTTAISIRTTQPETPTSVDVWNTPLDAPGIVDYDAAFFLQDTWTIKRLTVNPGVRIEWFSAGMRAASAPSGRFVPERFFPEERGLLKWGPDYAPRFAVAYDLFGNGRTAIKGNYSKYHRQYDADPAAAYSPIGIISERRNWLDCVANAAVHRMRRRQHRRDQPRRHRAGSRDRSEPRRRHVRDGPQQHARRSRSPLQLGNHCRLPASAEPARRARRDDVQADHP